MDLVSIKRKTYQKSSRKKRKNRTAIEWMDKHTDRQTDLMTVRQTRSIERSSCLINFFTKTNFDFWNIATSNCQSKLFSYLLPYHDEVVMNRLHFSIYVTGRIKMDRNGQRPLACLSCCPPFVMDKGLLFEEGDLLLV